MASLSIFCFEAEVVFSQFYLSYMSAAWVSVTEKLRSSGQAISHTIWSISWYGIGTKYQEPTSYFGTQKAVTVGQKFTRSSCLSKKCTVSLLLCERRVRMERSMYRWNFPETVRGLLLWQNDCSWQWIKALVWTGRTGGGRRKGYMCISSLFLFSAEVQGLTSKSYSHPFAQNSS